MFLARISKFLEPQANNGEEEEMKELDVENPFVENIGNCGGRDNFSDMNLGMRRIYSSFMDVLELRYF